MSSNSKPRVWDILEYAEHKDGLNRRLFPVQRFILKLYYGLLLGDVEKAITIRDPLGTPTRRFTEVEYLQYLHDDGRCNISSQDHMRNELVLAVGRRSGKSTLGCIIASYEVYRLLSLGDPHRRYGLPEEALIQVLTISNDKEQAAILFCEMASHFGRCRYFRPLITGNTLSNFAFRSPRSIEMFGPAVKSENDLSIFPGKPNLRATVKSCSTKGLRGYSNAAVVFDEMAYYAVEDSTLAQDIYNAVVPSTASYYPKGLSGEPHCEARIAALSSPAGKVGKFYELFSRAMAGNPGYDRALALQIPTWEANPTLPASYYRQCLARDQGTFDAEFGAKFL